MLVKIPRRRFDSVSSGESRQPPSSFTPAPAYSHVSTYRSLQMEMQIQSPSIKMCDKAANGSLPVFSDHDQIRGRVILDPSCSSNGRLVISFKGLFLYTPLDKRDSPTTYVPEQKSHVFLSTSTAIPVSPNNEPPRSAFRDAFSASIRRRPSASSLAVSYASMERSYSFNFDLPRSCRSSEELPASFQLSETLPGYEVQYVIVASWEPSDGIELHSSLETPVLVQPERDFQSLDCSPLSKDSWLEMPLRCDRPMLFRCAATLPSQVTFSRGTSIPYFVVFTTNPRSPSLAREIASDATISVSFIQQTTIQETIALPPTPPHTPTSSIDENEPARSAKLLKRVGRPRRSPSSPTLGTDASVELREKPLPRLPTETTHAESKTLHSSICIGFPKRPRHPCAETQNHPSLETQHMLPDGLHKSKIPLSSTLLPSIDWVGVSVKYYVDISVLFGQDDLRVRIPVKIT